MRRFRQVSTHPGYLTSHARSLLNCLADLLICLANPQVVCPWIANVFSKLGSFSEEGMLSVEMTLSIRRADGVVLRVQCPIPAITTDSAMLLFSPPGVRPSTRR